MSIADKNFNRMGSTSVHRIRSIHRELPERLFRGSIQQQLASSYLNSNSQTATWQKQQLAATTWKNAAQVEREDPVRSLHDATL
jgi:hypothetical protein